MNRSTFLGLNPKGVPRVILIKSSAMQLREAKQKVYAEYAHYIDAEDIYIQHASENFDYVAKLYAFKRASAFSEIVKSLKRSIPLAQLASIISTAADRAMTREKIRTKCYDVYIECEGERIGTVRSSTYRCFYSGTVNSIKQVLVKATLENIGNELGSEIGKDILQHIRSKVQSELQHDMLRLQFEMPPEIIESLSFAIIGAITFIFFPLLGLVLAMGSIVVTFFNSVDVNSTEWRRKVANEVYDKVQENRNEILKKIQEEVRQMCEKTVEDLESAVQQIEKLKSSIHLKARAECKYNVYRYINMYLSFAIVIMTEIKGISHISFTKRQYL